MPVQDRVGASPTTGSSFITELIRTHEGTARLRPFVLVEDMSKPFARQFYSSKAWQDCRNEYMRHAHYLCENCLRKGIYRPAEIVHHIIELTPVNITNPEVALCFDNLEAVCRECHNEYHDNHGRWAAVNQKKRENKKAQQRYAIDKFGKVSAR